MSKRSAVKTCLLSATTLVLAGACSWVNLTEEGENVRVLSQDQVGNCERIGTTTSKVMDRVAIIDRSEEKQAGELSRLARNEAANMNGNAIVPATEIDEGRQRFTVYRC